MAAETVSTIPDEGGSNQMATDDHTAHSGGVLPKDQAPKKIDRITALQDAIGKNLG